MSTVSIPGIPIELICEILLLSDLKDIPNIRKTCQGFLEVTEIHAVWQEIVNRYHKSNWPSHRPTHIYVERPIFTYTLEDLDQQCRLWKGAKDGWKSNNKTPALIRTFNVPQHIWRVDLITGGRWLLFTNEMAGVTYYDLEAKHITGTTLIKDQYQFERGVMNPWVTIDVEADPQDGFLKFNIAFAFVYPTNSDYTDQIRIWSVDLIKGASNRASGLSAKLAATLPCLPDIISVKALSLYGRTLAYSATYTFTTLICTFVVDWTRAYEHRTTSNSDTRHWRMIEAAKIDGSFDLFLLPKDKILCRVGRRLSIHNYSGYSEYSQKELEPAIIRGDNHPDMPQEIDAVEGLSDVLSRDTTFHMSPDGEMSVVMFFTKHVAYRVVVSHTDPPGDTAKINLSYMYTVAIRPQDVVKLKCVNADPKVTDREIEIPSKFVEMSNPPRRSIFQTQDFESGRIVVVTNTDDTANIGSTDIEVLDLSLIFQPWDT